MRLFIFICVLLLIFLFAFVLYCILRVGAEADRRMEEYLAALEKSERDADKLC